jgi:hypothetical protein
MVAAVGFLNGTKQEWQRAVHKIQISELQI